MDVSSGEVLTTTVAIHSVTSPVITAGSADADEAVVFVHGYPGSRLDWEDLVRRVGEFGRAVALDMPGFGDAAKPADFEYTVGGYARHLDGALQALQIRRAHLVLHDFGGPWGLALAAGSPDLVGSVTLINTGVPIGYRWHTMAMIWRTPVLGELSFALASGRLRRAALRRGNPRGLPEWYVERMLASLRDPGTQRAILRLYRASGTSTNASRLADALRPQRLPALVVRGRHDPYLPVELAERQREVFPDPRIVVLEESGHWPFIDNPDAVAAEVVPFLRRQLRRGVSEQPDPSPPSLT